MRVGLLDYDKRNMIVFISDGASVNFGPKSGLLTKLKMYEKMPWLVGIQHHHLELVLHKQHLLIFV